MPTPNASYSITLRLVLASDDHAAVGRVTTAIGDTGGAVTGMDMVERVDERTTIDVTLAAGDSGHAERIRAAVDALDDVEVKHLSDRTFLMHLRGKLAVRAPVPIQSRVDLSLAYTRGVARV